LIISALGVGASPAGADEWELVKTFGPDGTALTGFTTAGSIAVDHAEEAVYVLDREGNALFKFDLEGNPLDFGGSSPNLSGNKLSGLSIGGFPGERQVAVDSTSHTVYLAGEQGPDGRASALQAFHANGEPAVFTAGAGQGTNQIQIAGIRGIAVDTSGNIYTSWSGEGGEGDLRIYAATGALIIPTFRPSVLVTAPAGLAVDTNGVLYALRNNTTVGRLTPSEYPVTPATVYTQSLTPVAEHARNVAVDPATSRLYVVEESPNARIAVFNQAGALEATFGGTGEEGELELPEGVAAHTQDGLASVFASQSPTGELSQVKAFQEEVCTCPPIIESETVLHVTADSATVQARINPQNLNTTYWFEYGLEDCATSECSKIPLDGTAIGSGRRGVFVQQVVSGLQAQTRYSFRVVAKNSEGTERGDSRTFTTQGSGLGFALSDHRAWELVSPSVKFGGKIVSSGTSVVQASVSGDGFVYPTLGPVVELGESNRSPEPATVLAGRDANGRWASRDLTPRHSSATEFLAGNSEYKLFSPDLLQSEMEPTENSPLSPDASERTPYLWTDEGSPQFTPLVDPSNVPPGTIFGPEPGEIAPVRIEGASQDLSDIVIRSDRAPLTVGAEQGSVYLWSSGVLAAVSELPDAEGGDVVKAVLGSGPGSVRHAISDTGSRIFWSRGIKYTDASISLEGLYLRNAVSGDSVRLDVVSGGSGAEGEGTAAFNVASRDGSVVFFTDGQHLTANASPDGRDLYRCEIGPVAGGFGCVTLTDISVAIGGLGESAEVLDQASAASEDGSRLYFVARGVLDGQPNEEGETPTSGESNLYYWQEGQGVEFIGTLAKDDYRVWGGRPGRGYAVNISATASPDGRFFAFTSERSLTGYENRNGSGQANTEVFVYDAEAETDQLACVSCNPAGAAAIGEQLPSKVTFFPPDPAGLWINRWVAATLPEASQTEFEGRSLYQPRSVLDNGRVFFNSVDPLVPADSNGNWDVYQYEPLGVGTCTTNSSTAAVSRSGNGCIGLISSGTAEGDAGFLDATESGDNAFFLTRGRLSVLDSDNEIDVYDARIGGIPAVQELVQKCTGEACHSAVAPPIDPTPASQSFRGNKPPLQCRKGQRKVHRQGKVVCVRKKHHKRKHHKKPAGTDRRAKR
jgi:DNA-binding beta-propeller fold protein YncE